MEDQYAVLMIDDEKDIIYSFASVFKHNPYVEFLSAVRAHEGIELAKAKKPRVILLDLKMPGTSGEEILEELSRVLPETKFIIMTGWEGNDMQAKIEKYPGVVAYFHKPVELEKVITKIMSLIMLKEKTDDGNTQ